MHLLILLVCLAASSIAAEPATDGWCTGEVSLNLEQSAPVAPLLVRGLIPAVGTTPFVPTLSVRIDEGDAVACPVGPGAFEFRMISTGVGRHRIRMRFSEERLLPPPDGRQVGGRVTRVEFESLGSPAVWAPASEVSDIIPSGCPVGLGAGWGPFESWKGETFRWLSGAPAQLAVMPGSELALRILAEPGPSLGGKPCVVRIVDGVGRLIDKILIAKRGSYDVIVPALELKALPLSLRLDGELAPVPGDGRSLGLRVFGITLRP